VSVDALVVHPGSAGSLALVQRPDPVPPPGWVIARTVLVGVCGTDAEIAQGSYGSAPAGSDELVLGHEALVEVTDAPDGCELQPGDLVVPFVRRPDPVPCAACAAGEWDMCENGRFTEHGIGGADGFAQARVALDPGHAIRVPAELGELAVLVEPASVVAKAWAQVDHARARATHREPATVVVTGAGPVGLLAALMAVERGHDTHVLDLVDAGPKPEAVRALGAAFHSGRIEDLDVQPDIVVECTGVGAVVLAAIDRSARNGVVCLTGLSSGHRSIELEPTALNRRIVLDNDVVIGSVNANARHYAAAVRSLAHADRSWLERLVTRRVPMSDFHSAFTRQDSDIKVCLRPT
jgi:threonine dehydrogenase-like Zn-dependent dehydrogenase